MQEGHHMTIDNVQKESNRGWTLKVFLYITFLALGSFIFTETPFLHYSMKINRMTDFRNPRHVPVQLTDENCLFTNLHIADHALMADDELQEPQLIISEFMAINGSKRFIQIKWRQLLIASSRKKDKL